jgi:hypothetical protein
MDALATQAQGRHGDPTELLYLLRYGAGVEGKCSPATKLTATRWIRLDTLPSTVETEAGPFGRLMTGLIQAGTTLEIGLDHSDEGLALYLGGTADTLQRGRRMMAPLVDSRPMSAPAQRFGWHELGVVFRLLNRNADGPEPSAGHTPLLERLGATDGDWRLRWTIAGCDLGELDALSARIEDVEETVSQRKSKTEQLTATTSTSTTSSGWARVERWLAHLHDHLSLGRSVGLWQVTTHASSPEVQALTALIAACRAAIPIASGRVFATDVCTVGTTADPAPTSVLTSSDVSAMLAAPTATSPGIQVRQAICSGRRAAVPDAPLMLGNYYGTDVKCQLDLEDLEGHAFIAGTTGAGKTATVIKLVAEAWNRHRVPCLIVDPVKADYTEAATHFKGGLNVVNGATLCMNILQPWPGTSVELHIARVSQAFRGSFSMPAPAPYVVTQMFDTLLTQRGGPGDQASLTDVRDSLDALVRGMGYGAENTANIRAAVMTRLNLLLAPTRAHRFNWPDSASLRRMFTSPTVVTLADLGDDEERSFIVLLLALAIWSAARTRTRPNPVEHLLVLEEAHRVIPETSQLPLSDESGSAQRESAALLTSMLAEVRSFGQQVLVVDQSPAKVASDVVRNTNLKIAHRVVHPDDQRQLGGSLGLPEDECAALGTLDRGQVVISTRTEPAPQMVRVALASAVGAAGPKIRPVPPVPWPCCAAAGTRVVNHFLAAQRATDVASQLALFLVGIRFGEGDGAKLRQYVFQALLRTSSMRDLNRECLAWSGIRTVLAVERALGLTKSPGAFQTAVDVSYAAWETKRPAEAALGVDVRLPAASYTARCDMCDEMCGVRVPAQLRLAAQPRTGLRGLTVSTRRDALPAIEHAVARDTEVLVMMLGHDAAWRLQRCQIAQAVHHAQLDRGIAQQIETNVRKILTTTGATP